MPPTTLSQLAAGRGYNGASLAREVKVAASFMQRVLRGDFSPNHPVIPALARALGLAEPELATFARKPPLTGHALSAARHRTGARNRPREKAAGMAVVRRADMAPAKREDAKRRYNSLRLLDKSVRQVARSLATQTTVAMLKGERLTHVAVPARELAVILNDWFRLRGIPTQVVVENNYEEVFG